MRTVRPTDLLRALPGFVGDKGVRTHVQEGREPGDCEVGNSGIVVEHVGVEARDLEFCACVSDVVEVKVID